MSSNWRVDAAENKLLPTVIDELARTVPDTIWAEYPSSSNTFDNGFDQITYAQFANAVNGIAHAITQRLGRSDTGEPLAWLAPNDPRCSISIIAAMKAGFKLFLISERNSVAANHKLFDDVHCSTIITTDNSFAPLQATQLDRALTVIELPPIQQLLNDPQPDYPYVKNLSTSHDDIAFMVHTSGSTGFPKPMSLSHAFLAKVIRDIGISAPEGYDMQTSMMGDKRCILLLPLGHPAGVNFGIFLAFFTNTTVILPLPSVPPTGEALVQMLRHTRADWAALAPLTLETISKNISLLETLAQKLKTLVFSGGSLPKVFGDVISSEIKLLSFLGSSETGPLPAMYQHGYDFKNDWNYLQFPPELGATFDPRPGGVYELVFKRRPETEPYQPVFTTFPGLTEFRTRDLFTKHPSIPGLWTHASRSDDVIVFINGEKVNPIDYESQISRHAEVSGALMFGQQRFEAGLLVELYNKKPLSVREKAEMIEHLWPTIEAANRNLPAYAQVSQTHICFTDPETPLQRTLKGSIRRMATLDLYRDVINQVYTDVEEIWTTPSDKKELESEETVRRLVKEALHENTKFGATAETDDFFQRGMDSLQVLRLVRYLRSRTGLSSINPSTIYLNPSIGALTASILQLSRDEQISEKEKMEQQINTRHLILQKYINKIDTMATSTRKGVGNLSNRETQGQVVLLTGSTGTIGSYILRSLLQHPEVTHIYCLNRSTDSANLQCERNAQIDSSLPLEFPESKVTFLTIDLSDSLTLGLPAAIFETLKTRATLVIHNAWTVDFNLPLQSFEPQLVGLVNLISFCAQSSHQAALTFISSISSVMNFGTLEPKRSTVPETILSDLRVSADAGYAESKYIGERIIGHASQQLGLRSTRILRLGQIAGAANTPGRWNPADWIPALIQGSRKLGVLPDSIDPDGFDDAANNDTTQSGTIDWLPIDTAADVIVEVGIESATFKLENTEHVPVLHLINPKPTSWKSLLPAIVESLQTVTVENKEPIQIVTREEWLMALRTSATQSFEKGGSTESQDAVLRANPAFRLLGFFQMRFGVNNQATNRLSWETKNAERASAKLMTAKAIDGEMMGRWVRQWLL